MSKKKKIVASGGLWAELQKVKKPTFVSSSLTLEDIEKAIVEMWKKRSRKNTHIRFKLKNQ